MIYRCCRKCYTEISMINPRAADLWVTACRLTSSLPDYMLTMPEDTIELQLLEHMGFTLSTETDQKIYVWVLNETELGDDDFIYCRYDNDHGDPPEQDEDQDDDDE